jgi:hypothetical protein
MKSRENLVGAWIVLIGVVIAIILGVVQQSLLISYRGWIYSFLALLGVVIGSVSISSDSEEVKTFLLATVALVIVTSIGQERLILISNIGLLIGTIMNALLTMFVPATIIVSLEAIFSIANVR